MNSWRVEIPDWTPPTVNDLLRGHWVKKYRLKKAAAKLVAGYCVLAGVPEADGPRKVSLRLEGWPAGNLPDPDNLWKVLLDSLVSCRRLIDDSSEWCELGDVEVLRSKRRRTVILIEGE